MKTAREHLTMFLYLLMASAAGSVGCAGDDHSGGTAGQGAQQVAVTSQAVSVCGAICGIRQHVVQQGCAANCFPTTCLSAGGVNWRVCRDNTSDFWACGGCPPGWDTVGQQQDVNCSRADNALSYSYHCTRSEPICDEDSECDDGLFCNGRENCDPYGNCEDRDDPCSGACDEAADECVGGECTSRDECDDGIFCNGRETCNRDGTCVASQYPRCRRPGSVCIEAERRCTVDTPDDPPTRCFEQADCPADLVCSRYVCRARVPCQSDGECDDGRFCNGTESCEGGYCVEHNDHPCRRCDEQSDQCL